MGNLASWFFGPQLLGVVFLIIGIILYLFPPKRINNYYGYRTESSKRNQQTWDAANRYSTIYLLKISLVLIIAGFILTALLKEIAVPLKIKVASTVLLLIVSGMAPAILTIVSTEKYLTKTFGDKV